MDLNYFKLGSPSQFAAAIFAFVMGHLGCYSPSTFPDEYLGPVGALYRLMAYSHPAAIRIFYYGLVVAHLYEACQAMRICGRLGITVKTARAKWFVQTFLLGVFSLRVLRRLEKDKIH